MTGPNTDGRKRPIRVLSIPDRRSTTQFVPLFCRGLEEAGVELVDLGPAALRLGFDIIHVHFPVHYIAERSLVYGVLRSAFLLCFLSLAKVVGRCRIVYTVHDPIPFRPRAGWLMWPMLGFVHRMVDGLVFLSDGSQRDFLARFPQQAGKPAIRVDHSSFPVAVDPASRLAWLEARAAVPDRREVTVGYLGMIKDYKGLDFLAALPSHLPDGTVVRTIVAGRVDPTFAAVADPILAGLGDGFTRIDKRLSDDELASLIQQVDVMFLPYTRGWNSGMAMLVLSCFTPMLSTRQLPFVEVEQQLGAPWVHTFEGSAQTCQPALAAALTRVRQSVIDRPAVDRLAVYLHDRSFEAAGRAVVAFYDRLLARSR